MNANPWKRILGSALLLAGVLGSSGADASIVQKVADFGEVVAGETKSIQIRIANQDEDFPLQVLLFLQGGDAGFWLGSSMMVLKPGETRTVSVYYGSTGQGEVSDTLTLAFRSGRIPEEVLLKAKGVRPKTPMGIHSLAALFEGSVDEGTLFGGGSGKPAERLLSGLRDTIFTARSLYDMGDHQQACRRLEAAARDLRLARDRERGGSLRGKNALELAGMIEEVRDDLCGDGTSELAWHEAAD